MTPPSTTLAPDRERASAAAWGTLCVLAVLQVGIAARLMLVKEPLTRAAPSPAVVMDPPPSIVPEIGQIAQPPPSAPPAPGMLAAPTPTVVPQPAAPTTPPPIGSFQLPSNLAPAVPAMTPAKMPAASPPTPSATAPTKAPSPPQPTKPDAAAELLRDVNYVVNTAKEIRGAGDMNGALELLRRADELTPDHPAIIAEMAQTYEQMGVAAKATDNWRRIQLLGEVKAGSYFGLASRRLGAGDATATAISDTGMTGDKVLRLGACHAQRDFSAASGERYTVRVPIQRSGSQPVDSRAVNLEVFFFDRVNGTTVAQSIAPEPLESWQSAPVDWAGSTGEETLDVVYHLPALSNAEVQQHGRRSYYGYMLRLYYHNKLQDVAAEPRDLLEFGAAPGSVPAGANPLLPPAGR